MSRATSIASPLTPQQKTVWSAITKGLSVSAVAKKLKTTRQYVNQTRLTAEAKLSATLLEVAQINDLQVTRLYPKQAILLGYHPTLRRKVIVTYTAGHGVKVWYWYDNPEEETDPELLKQTREYLLEIAHERGVEIENAETLHPARLAQALFCELIPDVRL
jgi:hypothetical protein